MIHHKDDIILCIGIKGGPWGKNSGSVRGCTLQSLSGREQKDRSKTYGSVDSPAGPVQWLMGSKIQCRCRQAGQA